MSTDNQPGPGGDGLQFDREEPSAPATETAASDGPLTCAACNAPIRAYYYHVNGSTACASCKGALERSVGLGAGAAGSRTGRALLFGLGAAVAGAAIYYAVIALTGWEIGLVAILIGFMVGKAVRSGAAGRGGRKYQVMAAALTYFAVGLAYAPLTLKEMLSAGTAGDSAIVLDDSTDAAASTQDDSAGALAATADADSIAGASDGAEADDASAAYMGTGGIFLAIGMTFLFVFALPVLIVFGSLPSGLISGVIIGFGCWQAWQMTGAPQLSITGPHRIGDPPPVPAQG
jgi:hypothetical protein